MEIDLVSWKEAVLSRHFSFVRNKEISGFGIHDPEGSELGKNVLYGIDCTSIALLPPSFL
ncbi:hypothetical protein QUB56_27600 [Microcoleus sp. AR_TQ3_B6]